MRGLGAFFALTLLIGAPAAHAGECDFLADWQAAEELQVDDSMTSFEIHRVQVARDEARDEAADRLFANYMSGKMPAGAVDRCLPDAMKRSRFRQSIASRFFERSLERLAASPSPVIRRFTNRVRTLANSSTTVPRGETNGEKNYHLLSLQGHSIGTAVNPNRKAAFNRSQGSIYMDLDRIPPAEWLITFCHELAHALNRKRFDEAAEIFGDVKLVALIAARAQKTESPEDLSPPEQKSFDRWLIAALDQGLLGEYRAWTVTLILYLEGLKSGIEGPTLWSPIPRFEKWLELREKDESMANLVIRYLHPRFIDPDPRDPENGLFTMKLVHVELQRVRERLVSDPPPLFELEPLIAP